MNPPIHKVGDLLALLQQLDPDMPIEVYDGCVSRYVEFVNTVQQGEEEDSPLCCVIFPGAIIDD